MSVLAIIGRLTLAAVCSGLIGFERETAQKAAGLRTHTLVGVGAAIFAIVSITGFEGSDEARVAAQVVTGVGFLGAGAIFREGAFVKGLTTAAGLWAVAALGLAAGAGAITLAIVGTVTSLVVLYSLRGVDRAVALRKKKAYERLEISIKEAGKVERLLEFIRRIDPDARQVAFKRSDGPGGVLTVAVAPNRARMLSEMLASHKNVVTVEQLSPLFWRHGEDE